MKILALPRYSRIGASSRLRFYQYFPYLQEHGIETDVQPLLSERYVQRLYAAQQRHPAHVLSGYGQRLNALLGARRFDLIWLEKELFPNVPAWFEKRLHTCRIPYVVDYDDAIFHSYDLSRNPFKRLMSRKIDRVMQAAGIVVCGNAYLAERARQAGARRVEIMPTVVDLRRYALSERPRSGPIVIGWIGSPATVKYLEEVSPVLQRLSVDFPVRLRVIGAQFSAPGVDVECRVWSEEIEAAEIQDFDIGIMPLRDSPWERGKCGYKLIQYMACGLPCVASAVGVNEEIIREGVNGHLARNRDAWFTALSALCADAGMRRAMGAEGRRMVEQSYALQITAPRLAELFAEAVAAGVA